MSVLKTLQPGEPGTKRLTRQFGAQLVCVRYRYDPKTGARLTTVEIEVDRAPLQTRAGALRDLPGDRRIVRFRLLRDTRDLRRDLLNGGAVWRPDARSWEASAGLLSSLNLLDRVEVLGGPGWPEPRST